MTKETSGAVMEIASDDSGTEGQFEYRRRELIDETGQRWLELELKASSGRIRLPIDVAATSGQIGAARFKAANRIKFLALNSIADALNEKQSEDAGEGE